MSASLFGLEAELAISARKGETAVPVMEAVQALAHLAERELVHLRGDGSRLFLANGSLFYIDAGCHPEVATPECETPWQAVCHLRGAERMIAGLAALMRKEHDFDEVLVCRGNVDYLTGATWGCHESYLTRLPIKCYESWLVPHLVSRILYTGSGGLDPLSPGIRFSLSPRAAHIVAVSSRDSTSNRGIFHTRDESLCTGYNRLHVLSGDNACSQLSTLLKVGTTALVVALAEHRGAPPLRLQQPVLAMKGFARDIGFRAEVEMPHATCLMSALDIQHHYLAGIEAWANTKVLPEWAAPICAAWRAALEWVSRDAGRGIHAFDWPLKRGIMQRELDRSGFTWKTVEAWTNVLEGLRTHWPKMTERVLSIDIEKIERLRADRPETACFIDKAGKALVAQGLDWSQLGAFNTLRQRLCIIDVRFGQVNEGLFDTLDRGGMLPEHRVVTDDEIGAATERAPSGTRAHVRAQWVKRLASDRARYSCSWEGITGENVFLDLGNPFATESQWKKIDAA